jgi:plasmid stabilization system protein ParE
MKYKVNISPKAQAHIIAAYAYISDRSPLNGAKWFREVYEKIESLERFPRRFGFAREQSHLDPSIEIRQLIYKSHRIGFWVDDRSKTVHVLFVRHSAMRAIELLDDDLGPSVQ